MEDHVYEYDNINNNNYNINIYTAAVSSSSESLHNHHPLSSLDEISQFVHQILYHSSSSTTTATTTAIATTSSGVAHVVPLSQDNAHRLRKSTGISTVDSMNTSADGAYLSGNVGVSGANVSSSSVGVSENENTDEHDCQNEGVEPLVNEVQAKSERPSSSSKRSRTAEVHNLSEKRRRSRINEKMKALQSLIPNSNKTDKASMLDEAIDYLKHLQHQVQELRMRNGLSLHPMCLPGGLPAIQFSQMRMGIGTENGSPHMHSTGIPMNQETPMPNVFYLPKQRASSNQLQLPNVSNIINSETSSWVDSSIEANCGAFPLDTSPGEICRLNMLPNQQLNASHSETSPPVLHPCITQGSDQKEGSTFETCMIEGYQAGGVHLKNIERNIIFPPSMSSMWAGRNFHADRMKQERKDF